MYKNGLAYLVGLNKLPQRILSASVDPLSSELHPVSVDGYRMNPSAYPVQSLLNPML
jgi:hypothetical protein